MQKAPFDSDNQYEQDLDQGAANYQPLTPLGFLDRAADVYPDHPAIIYEAETRTWQQTRERCRRLASALRNIGVKKGDTVSVMAPNTPASYEAHFGIPMTGAVLNALNTRLDSGGIEFILRHAQVSVLLTDTAFAPVIAKALEGLEQRPIVIDIDDPAAGGERLGTIEYEEFLATGDPQAAWQPPSDEWDAISLNYTSGTTGNPKGVVYHHRGAYLNALSNVTGWEMAHHPRYLWTLPMFHCNGWCFPWTLAAIAGTSICTRSFTGPSIHRSITDHHVTHLCGAPIVLSMILNTPTADRCNTSNPVKFMTAAAPPPAAILQQVEAMGFDITHVYGLTETYGPAVMCAWKNQWNEQQPLERARLKSRQGVRYHALDHLDVMDPDTMKPVPRDGKTVGEVMFRGNIVMRGYLKNPVQTRESFSDGWFHSGDLAVMDPDGYLRITDRSKDVIISGGENISSIEVEDTLYLHEDVLEAAVVAMDDEKWGETPCAFVKLRDGSTLTEGQLIEWCRGGMAHFKCPTRVVFTELPKTSTGKIQKFALRKQAETLC